MESYLTLIFDIQLQWYFRDFLSNLRRISVFVFASVMTFILLVWSGCCKKDWICEKEGVKITKLLEEILKYLLKYCKLPKIYDKECTLLIINFGQFAVFQYIQVWFVQVKCTMALKVYILVVSRGAKQVFRT